MASIIRSTPKLSPSELRLLILIPEDGARVTTAVLLRKYFGDHIPYHGRTIITGLIRGLVKKTELLDGAFRVFASERAGPKPIEVWVEKKAS